MLDSLGKDKAMRELDLTPLPPGTVPLAELLRPKVLDDVVGQDALIGEGGRLARMLDAGDLASIIFWGPPGTGKTTIARLLADAAGMVFEPVSAVFDGVADLRKVFLRAAERQRSGQRTLLFVDEVHRFNKAQQDGLLPRVEDGTVTLVGATTENPSFALNGALLSRAQVMVLERLSSEALETLLGRVEAHIGAMLPLQAEARQALLAMADGDGRYLLNMASSLTSLAAVPDQAPIGVNDLTGIVAGRAPAFDRAGDQHYNLMSALHKTLRGSDADAALYWLSRMFAGGEDAHYILRRLTRFASEDIGLAEPQALPRALSAWQAYERLGSPEGDLAIASLVIYLATAPKSNAAYVALKSAKRAAASTGSLMPPAHILNAPTKLMKDIGYGADYAYDHDDPDGFSGQNGFPDEMPRQRFYAPMERGYEREIAKRLAYWDRLRAEKQRDG
jgi:putative ATPase